MFTPTLTPSPIHNISPIATSTSEQIISWGKLLGEPIVIKDFYGTWSPTSDELVGIHFTSRITGTLSLISAPEFRVQSYSSPQTRDVLYNPTWSPDGQSILFGVPYKDNGGSILDIDSYLWVIDRNGSNLRQLPGNYPGIDFPAWADRTTAVVTSFSGGGHVSVSEIDYLTGKKIIDDTVGYFFMGSPRGEYLPINSGEDNQVHIFSRELSYQPGCQLYCFTRQFPNQMIDEPNYFNTSFEDWFPEKIAAVVNAFRGDGTGTRLFLWDLGSNNVSTLIPGGISAHFSPDGQNLFFTTLGPYSQYSSSITDNLVLDPISNSTTVYLQLMKYPIKEVLISVPAITWEEFQNTPRGYSNVAWFSPDGRYLAFQSLGNLTLDKNGWPNGVESTHTGYVYLNILDLTINKLVYTISDFTSWIDLAWSPVSNQLIYRNTAREWMMLDLSKLEVAPITTTGGSAIFETPEWSNDGRYLSVTTMPPLYKESEEEILMYIFELLQ